MILFICICLFSCQKECDHNEENSSPCNVEYNKLAGDWIGTFDQYNLTEYEMLMFVEESSDECQFSGRLQWPSLNNSITTMEGYFENDSIFFTETEILQGSNIVLNGLYKAVFESETTITGTWDYPNGGAEGGSFKINM